MRDERAAAADRPGLVGPGRRPGGGGLAHTRAAHRLPPVPPTVAPTARDVRAIATAEKDASPAEVLEFAVTGGRVLASMVRTSPAHVRAYHPAGRAAPAGLAAR